MTDSEEKKSGECEGEEMVIIDDNINPRTWGIGEVSKYSSKVSMDTKPELNVNIERKSEDQSAKDKEINNLFEMGSEEEKIKIQEKFSIESERITMSRKSTDLPSMGKVGTDSSTRKIEDSSMRIMSSETYHIGGHLIDIRNTKAAVTNLSNANRNPDGRPKTPRSQKEDTISASEIVLNALESPFREQKLNQPSYSHRNEDNESSYIRKEESASTDGNMKSSMEDDATLKETNNQLDDITMPTHFHAENNGEHNSGVSEPVRVEEKMMITPNNKPSLALKQEGSMATHQWADSATTRSSTKIQSKDAPRMLDKNAGMQSANAYSRIKSLNNVNETKEALSDLPEPGSYGFSNHKLSLWSLISFRGHTFPRRYVMSFICLSILSIILILIEISYLSSAPNPVDNQEVDSESLTKDYNDTARQNNKTTENIKCSAMPEYVYCVSNCVICIVILEWLVSWLFIEASPMLLSEKFKSPVPETNVGIEMMLATLPPPAKSDPNKQVFVMNEEEARICHNPPQVKINDPLLAVTQKQYIVGAGLRGSVAEDMKYDRLRSILSFCVFILYLICIMMLFYGIYCLLDGLCRPLMLNFIIFHTIILFIRILALIQSSLGRGICKSMRRSTTQRMSTPPIVTNALDTQFPDFKNYSLFNT